MQVSVTLDIIFIVCEHMLATSVSLPMEQLRAAESINRAKLRLERRSSPTLNIVTASVDGKAKTSHTGIKIQPDLALADIERADIIFLPALWRNPQPVIANNQALVSCLREPRFADTIIAGVGTGCFFMAEAGLLNGISATTHWHYFDAFAKKYPKVKLQKKYFITQSGRFFCAGSVNALGDLTIHFIRNYFSAEIATHVERHFFHDIRRAYDRESLNDNQDHAHPDELIAEAQIKLRDNMSKQINFNKLAKDSGVSRRNFDRRFKNATGEAPLSYLQKLRMNAAKDLLKNSNLDINEVMEMCGYHDASYFSELFKKHLGTNPKQYRTTVRAKMFKTEKNQLLK